MYPAVPPRRSQLELAPKQIRCDRVKPTCDGCQVRGLPCTYPERRNRKKANPRKGQPKEPHLSDDVFSGLLERLLRVEEKCTHLVTDPSTAYTPLSINSPGSIQGSSSQIPGQTPEAHSVVSSVASGTFFDNDAEKTQGNDLPSYPGTPLIADVRLQQAFEQVLYLKRQNLFKQTVRNDHHIRPEIAKACIKNFCTHFQIDTFPSFINIKLMHFIPDIIDMPEVALDPAVLVLYYTWMERSVGTKTDLVSAILLMKASFQQCDFEFSWNMYRIVCQCVKKLNLHNLDQDFPSTSIRQSLDQGTDYDRQGLWALVLVDLFFRMLHDKPPIMTANLTEWHVNLPAINIVPEQPEYMISISTFFVKSRLTFLLLRFFDLLAQSSDDRDYIQQIEGLCAKIEDLIGEWSIRDLIDANEENASNWWTLYDLALTASCSMMVMSRKMEALHSEASGIPLPCHDKPVSDLSVNIARNVLKLALLGLEKYISPLAAAYLFGAFRCHVPYGCLVSHLFLSDPEEQGSTSLNDMALLEKVAQRMGAIAETDGDLLPLARTLHKLNISIHARWKEKMEQ
ncbi:unnamed protein product [Fusarium venenatum]|uniref:Zn(2)-C6 fungal-type domain-containing protein n=2 Tax=Fusarium venenatum TaxID=56646 RepID=A0A2L2T4Q5_9HYPO|nr:uncharacterized protein FVRRES_13944 [Fusarium venenatum]CEI57452.1 unnamed protein product [Fusarium venenatum]